MDRKSWPWKKKSMHKTIVETDKAVLSLKGNEEEMQKLLSDKGKVESELKSLQEKLSSFLAECEAKDDLVKKHEKMALEAVAGLENAKAENVSLKQKLDEALLERTAGEVRLTHLDGALRECMQQLRFVRDEQEQRIHDAVMKTSKEYEKHQISLEEKLTEMSTSLQKVDSENTYLSKALRTKGNIIEDLNNQRNKAEADVSALMARLESYEKNNASLKYEIRVLEKEVAIWNEEREFNRRTAEASHKQHLENVKKIAKLESECQRLRLLVRKRLPGPAALAKMKSEVEMLGRDSIEMRRRKLSASFAGRAVDGFLEDYSDNLSKSADIVTERLYAMEEENKTLKEALNKKTNELQFSRNMYSRTASKLLEVESQLEESSKGQTRLEPTRSEFSLASTSDIDNDDKVSCADSWASALISELEHFKNKKQKGSISIQPGGASEIDLMDDFVEMEKLAVGSSGEADPIAGSLETRSNGNSSEILGREKIPVSDYQSNCSISSPEAKIKSSYALPHWLHDINQAILEQKRVSGKGRDEILEEIRRALSSIDNRNSSNFDVKRESLLVRQIPGTPDVKGHASLRTETSVMTNAREADPDTTSLADNSNQSRSDLIKSIRKIIELIEGVNLHSRKYGASETPSGYSVRVLQWKTSELGNTLQQFLHTCFDMLNGKADVSKFSQDLSLALEWVMNHCFSLQDVSSMRDAIKKHFDWDEIRSESEAESGVIGQVQLPKEQLSCLSVVSTTNSHNDLPFHADEIESPREEIVELSSTEGADEDSKSALPSEIRNSGPLIYQLHESNKTIADLQKELEVLKRSESLVKDEVENHCQLNGNLEHEIAVIKVESNEAAQKPSPLEPESKNVNKHRDISDSVGVKLQNEPECEIEETSNHEHRLEQQHIRTDVKVTAASEKLAECQETILHLGKQLQALKTSKESAPSSNSVSTLAQKDGSSPTAASPAVNPPKSKLTSQKSSLLDRMMAEDDAGSDSPKSPKNKPNGSTPYPTFVTNETIEALEKILLPDISKRREDSATVNSSAIVPRKKVGVKSLWKKLIWRRKKSRSKKLPVPIAS